MQEVKDISNTFPRHINNLDLVVIVQKKGWQGSNYDFTVRKQRVMDSLLYKIQNYPYYQDARVDYNAVAELPKNATYISHMLKYGQLHGSNHTHTHTHIFGKYL